jgi:hypothetical protein
MLSQLSTFYFLQKLDDWPIFLVLLSFHGILSVVLSTSSSRVTEIQKYTTLNFNVYECVVGIFLVVYTTSIHGLLAIILFGSFLSIPLETHLKLNNRQFHIYLLYSIVNLFIILFLKSAFVAIIVFVLIRLMILLILNRPNHLRITLQSDKPNFNAYFLNRQNIITHYLGLLFVNMDNGMILKIFTSFGNLIGASLNVKNFQGNLERSTSFRSVILLNLVTILILLSSNDLGFIYGLVSLLQSFVSFLMWPLYKKEFKWGLNRLLLLLFLLYMNSGNLLIGYLTYESINIIWRQRI